MRRKTLILTENQFNEICGTNTAYLDNSNSYAEDGLTTTKTGGAVSDSNGEKEYSEPLTTDDYAHELAPETLFALLFRNGGHGLWGHWGSGLRADTMDGFDSFEDEFDYDDEDWDDERYDDHDDETEVDETDPDEIRAEIERLQSILDDLEDDDYNDDLDDDTDEDDFEDEEDDVKKKLQESNSELEGRYWTLDLDDSGVKKKYSYTNLATLKTVISQGLKQLIQQKAPKQQIERKKRVLDKICSVLNRETLAIKQRKTTRKNLGYTNQFQKEGGTKNPKNGRAHSIKDPNIGEGFITYA